MDRVLEIRCNVGVPFGREVRNGCSFERDGADMQLHPAGVYIALKGMHSIVPYGNINYVRLEGPLRPREPKSENGGKKNGAT